MKPGDRVHITTKNGLEFTGVLLEGQEYTLKLDDGYNVGVDKQNVKASKKLSSAKKTTTKPAKVPKDSSLPTIELLHTGGTIASKVDYATGGVSNKITPQELLALYPELQTVAQVNATFLSQMSSDDMRFAHYNELVNAVEQAVKKGVQGIIITHGTDTLHYTAAALHYALLGVPVPVVLVGSQRSADRGSSDAATNLLGAVHFITKLSFPGVYVAMHGSSNDDDIVVLRGVNARKNHTSRRDAFKPINVPEIARINKEDVRVVTEPPKSKHTFSPCTYKEDLKVGMVYVHPQFFAQALAPFEDYDGLVVLGTGLGHAPINAIDKRTKPHESVRKQLFRLAESLPVVMASQCINGRINLQVYSPGRVLQDGGVLGHDLALSPETVFMKLSWLLSQDTQKKSFSELLTQDVDDEVARIEERAYE